MTRARGRGWYVEIVRRGEPLDVEHVERAIGPYPSERGAERGERGVSINLDHARYSTRVVEEKAGK